MDAIGKIHIHGPRAMVLINHLQIVTLSPNILVCYKIKTQMLHQQNKKPIAYMEFLCTIYVFRVTVSEGNVLFVQQFFSMLEINYCCNVL